MNSRHRARLEHELCTDLERILRLLLVSPVRSVIWMFLIFSTCVAFPENGREAWLRYATLPAAQQAQDEAVPNSVGVLGDSVVLRSAQDELVRGVLGMLGKTLQAQTSAVRQRAIVLGTF